jgi:OPT family oligopeptide transporter
MEFDFDGIEEEDSPYPEVRASVSNIDDPDMPAMTIRMWFVGLTLCTISTYVVFFSSVPISLILLLVRAMNVFFNLRAPAPLVVPLALLLVSHPFGKLLAFTLPITPYRFPRFFGSVEISLNPGPWNIKEHALVFIMANVAISPPYAMNAIVVMEDFYEIKLDYWFNLILVLGTQLTGFGLAGLCRRFLVWPASMVWPQNLVACTLLNTLHAEDDEGAGGITRYKFFMTTLACSFSFFFLPGTISTVLIYALIYNGSVSHRIPFHGAFDIFHILLGGAQ